MMAALGREEVKKSMEDVLAEGLKPCLSGDTWSRNGAALLGLVVHTISPSWEMVEEIAGAIPAASTAHTGQWIEDESNKALALIGVDDAVAQVFRAKSDRAANMLKGFDSFKSDPCVCHIIETDTSVFTKFPAIADMLTKAKSMVTFFHHSTIGRATLHEIQKELNKPVKNLVQDVITRWRSTHAMCNSLREQREVLAIYEMRSTGRVSGPGKVRWEDLKLSPDEWTIVWQTVVTLHPLAYASTVLEGSKYPTSNLVFPMILSAIHGLAEGQQMRMPWCDNILMYNDVHPDVREARTLLHEALRKRWIEELPKEQRHFFLICTLLDPRFKALPFPLATEAMVAEAWKALELEYKMKYAPVAVPQAPQDDPERPIEASHTEQGGVTFVVNGVDSAQQPPPETEVDIYKREPAASPQMSHEDVLSWWMLTTARLPNLSRMARQHLSCPATSASAERVFSLAGRLFSDLAQAMKEENLQDRMWAKQHVLNARKKNVKP